MRAGAADGTGVGGDSAEFQPETGEDARVGVVHVSVLALQVGVIGVERVAILHGEFAPAHDAEARPALVAELGLDLVEMHRQLAIAPQLAAREIGDDLFGCRLDQEVALVPVLEAQQLRAVFFPAARFLPQLRRLHHRHRQLDRAGAVHLVAHDRLDLAHDAQAQRHPGVDAAGEAPDDACAQHQLVADDLRVGRSFPEGGDEELRNAHKDSDGWGGAILLEDWHGARTGDGPLSLRFEMWKNGANFSLR